MRVTWLIVFLMLLSSISAYTGCPGSSPIKVAARADDEYWLEFMNRDNVLYRVPFAEVSGGSLRYGRDQTRDFITQEVSGFEALLASPAPEDAFNINRKDTFLVTGGGLVGSSHVLEYESIDLANKVLVFEDLASGPRMVNFMPALGQDPNVVLGQFDLVVGGSTFRGFVLNQEPYPLSIDLDANGAINGDTAPVIVRGGGILDIGSNDGGGGGSIAVSLTTPTRNFRDNKGDESLEFTVSTENNQVSLGGIRYYRNGVLRTPTSIPSFDLYQDRGTNHYYGATDYGVLIQYFRPTSTPEELALDYPGMGPCAPDFYRPGLPVSEEPLPQQQSCQDSDDFNPYVKGRVSGTGPDGRVISVEDTCPADEQGLVKEGLCRGGRAGFSFVRCLHGCEEGACTARTELLGGVAWSCAGKSERHELGGCRSEKDLFEAALDFCMKACESQDCSLAKLDFGAVCEPLPEEPERASQPVIPPVTERPVEPVPEEPQASVEENCLDCVKKETPPRASVWRRILGWFSSLFG